MKIIGRIAALENRPTTIDEFYFWTDKNCILDPFDVIVVEHIHNSLTFGIVEEINHITDTPGYMGSYISNDFGDINISSPSKRIGMNYIKAKVLGNTHKVYIPVRDGSTVRLANRDEVSEALGLSNVKNAIPCGYLQMYSHETDDKVRLPVNFNGHFLIGPEGAHMNISGISGLAAKTSYAMFLIKGIQHKMMKMDNDDLFKEESVAFVVINVKGRDLLTLDKSPTTDQLTEQDKKIYTELGIDPTPFENVKYYYPFDDHDYSNTYASKFLINDQIHEGKGFKFKYTYEDDIDSLDLLLANVDDQSGTMESVCNYIQTQQGDFRSIRDWDDFIEKVNTHMQAGVKRQQEINVLSWRKFKRIIAKSIKNPMFARRVVSTKSEVRLSSALTKIQKNEIHVIDIAKLDENLQSFVFGDVIRSIYNLKLSQIPDVEEEFIPSKIIVFIDELNKYAGSDLPKNSPILRQIVDITERGRSLGIILFSAEQFKSAIHDRVKGNCSTHAYGRTNAIEVSKKDYSYIPTVYKNMMLRLSQGEYIVQNPIFRSLLHVRFPKPVYHQEK